MFVAAGLFVVVCVGCSCRGGERLVVRGGECVRLFCSNCQLKVSVYSSGPFVSLKKQIEILFRLIYCERKTWFRMKKQAEKYEL